MQQTLHTATDPTAAARDQVPSHCVFRYGASWMALPALAVREVMPRPDMVTVPGTPASLVGLSHVRSEFVPVLDLSAMLPDQPWSDGRIMLILDDLEGAWAVLVDEVAALQPLEVSDAPETDGAGARDVVSGWATWEDTVLQILDPVRIRGLACQALSDIWRSSNPLRAASGRCPATAVGPAV